MGSFSVVTGYESLLLCTDAYCNDERWTRVFSIRV